MKLLVSVRSTDEALAALAGGADLIDIKEPSRGPLGRADVETMKAIVAIVGGRAPVSAAMGELKDLLLETDASDLLAYIKFGLSGCIGLPWQERLIALTKQAKATVVPVAYADFERAECPSVRQVIDFAIANRFGTLLIDTFHKDGSCLLDWFTESDLQQSAMELADRKIALALAGSLRKDHLQTIKRINPAWVAVRGAFCVKQDRSALLNESLVREFRTLID